MEPAYCRTHHPAQVRDSEVASHSVDGDNHLTVGGRALWRNTPAALGISLALRSSAFARLKRPISTSGYLATSGELHLADHDVGAGEFARPDIMHEPSLPMTLAASEHETTHHQHHCGCQQQWYSSLYHARSDLGLRTDHYARYDDASVGTHDREKHHQANSPRPCVAHLNSHQIVTVPSTTGVRVGFRC